MLGGDVGWEDARDAGQAQPVPCSFPKALCRDEIPAGNGAGVALGALRQGGQDRETEAEPVTSSAGSCGTGLEGGRDQPGDPKHLGEPGQLPVGSVFWRGGTHCSPGMCPAQHPVGWGGQRGPAGASGTWAMAGDTTQSLTSAHPSAGEDPDVSPANKHIRFQSPQPGDRFILPALPAPKAILPSASAASSLPTVLLRSRGA